MSDRDEHLEVLRAMWGELKAMNGRIGETNERLERTNGRLEGLDQRFELLTRRVDSIEVNVVGALAIGNERLAQVLSVARDARLDRHRLDDVERRVDALEKKVG